MFWVPRTRELIGLTTNHEHGYWLAKFRSKILYGRPSDSYRNSYLDIMWQMDAEQESKSAGPIFAELPNLIIGTISLAKRMQGFNRVKSRTKVESPYGEF